jgi:mRNA-degrading endonuclease RelE of RelBE toxin-antitoxin system
MKRILVLPSFEHSLRKLTPRDRESVSQSLEAFNVFLSSGDAPLGFGFKKTNRNKYELRVGIKLRVVVKVEGEDYYLVLVGSHDEVKRYLRRYRQVWRPTSQSDAFSAETMEAKPVRHQTVSRLAQII